MKDRAVQETARPDAKSLTILVVEDHLPTAEAIQLYLTHLGVRVVLSRDGREALAVLATEVPDVILCDLRMPRMSGQEFIRHLRRDPRLAHIVVIAITGYESRAGFERALADGFDACLSKPVTWDDIMGAFRAACRPR